MQTLNSILLGLLILILSSCSDSIEDPQLREDENRTCNELPSNKYDLLGLYHNEILSTVNSMGFTIESCSEDELSDMKELMDEIINSNPAYDALFSPGEDWQSINPSFHTVDFPICEIETPKQLLEISENLISNLTTELQSLELFTSTEVDFLKNILAKLLTSQPGDQLSLQNEYEFVSNNIADFYRNGEFTYTILSVMKYSYCYWNTQYESEQQISTRRLWKVFKKWLGVKGPVGDVIGAYSSGIKNLIETGGYYDPNRDLFEEMGNGALEGSLGVTALY